MRFIFSFSLLLSFVAGFSQDRILLVPVDSRPAGTQFPEMIAKIAGVKVEMPPVPYLGRFTKAGSPSEVIAWLKGRDLNRASGLVLNADMLAYGGLIASRVPDTTAAEALQHVSVLKSLRSKSAKLPIYVFSSLMRTAPTATQETKSFRVELARFAELRERLERTKDTKLKFEVNRLRRLIPKQEIDRYYAARARNMDVHKALIRYVALGVIDYLVIGADDAQAFGPHFPEMQELRLAAKNAGIAGKVYFCEGVDQHANLLVSRLLLRNAGWTPKVFVQLRDPAAGAKRAAFESTTLSKSIEDQIIASGGRPTSDAKAADYKLYLNTPGTTGEDSFAMSLLGEAPVAIADVNLVKGHSDAKLMAALSKSQSVGDLLAFAGWNTAGNTIGTTIPHANLYLLSKRLEFDPLQREIAHREFLLHRIVNDYGYHRYIRPAAYTFVDGVGSGSREEAYGNSFRKMEDWVARNTKQLLEATFYQQFEGLNFAAGSETYKIVGLENVKVELPWPRAFEVAISFDLVAEKVVTAPDRPR